jgi:sugar O-acyltransferase (sialic acid O-acetyltransferase NeuD family)
MAKVVLFGVRDFSELACYYLRRDSVHEVVAFSVHRQYMSGDAQFCGLPIVPFEEVEVAYPARNHQFFAPMSAKNMNRDRQSVYEAIKGKGYQCISYISSKATVFDNQIGENCFILEDNTIQPFTKIGNNVVLWSGNHIGHHGVIRDHVTFTSHVVMSGHCDIGSFSYFGVNSTIRDGLRISEGTFVQMASAVEKDTDAWGVYRGSPAEKLKIPSTRIRM